MGTKTKPTKTADWDTSRFVPRIQLHQSRQEWKSNARITVTGSGRTTSAYSPSAATHGMRLRPFTAVQPSTMIPNRHARKGVGKEADELTEALGTAQNASRNKYPSGTADEGYGTMIKRQIHMAIFNISVKVSIGISGALLCLFVIFQIFQKHDPPQTIQATAWPPATVQHTSDDSSAVTRQGDGGVSVNCLWDCNIYVNSPQQAPPRAATNAVRPQ